MLWLLLFSAITFHMKAAELLLEAEDATLNGVNVSTAKPGYSGAGYVTDFHDDGDLLTWNFTATAGTYILKIGYQSEYGDKATISKLTEPVEMECSPNQVFLLLPTSGKTS